MSKELEVAKELALKTGKLVMEYYKKKDIHVELKNNEKDNFLTEADLKCQKIIKEELLKKFPDYGFIGEEEEEYLKPVNKDYVWIVDPIDGTKAFVQHLDEFGIHIGLAYKGKPVLGVVYLPVYDKLFYAKKGEGAFLNGKKIQVSDCKSLEESTLVITHKIKTHKEWEDLAKKVEIKKKELLYSTGIKISKVAVGDAELSLFKENFPKEWDFCAPHAILNEAGGKMTTFSGKEITYNRGVADYSEPVVISNGLIHNELLEILNENPE